MKRLVQLTACLGLLMALSSLLPAQADPADLFKFRLLEPKLAIEAGKAGEIKIEAKIETGYYLYYDMLSLTAAPLPGFTFLPPVFPEPHKKYEPVLKEEKKIYEGTVLLVLPFRTESTAAAGGQISLTVNFQGCSGELCYMPDSLQLTLPYSMKKPAASEAATTPAQPAPAPAPPAAGQPGKETAVTAAVPAAPGPVIESKPPANSPGTTSPPPAPAPETGSPQNYRSIWAFLMLFGYGVLTSLMPCVYPVIPITISIFGALGAENKLKSFLLSLVYTQGLGLVYALLGLAAASAGSVFGQHLGNPWVVGTLAVIFLLLALFMAGVFQLNVPASLQTSVSKVGGKGFAGAFAMGMVAGIIAAPCTGPALAGVLTWIGTTRDRLLGFFLLYTYAMGIGLLFLVLGTFSSLMKKIPRSGGWMELVKSIFAAVMVVMALYYVQNMVPFFQFEDTGFSSLLLTGVLFLAVGFFGGGLRIDLHDTNLGGYFRKFSCILLLALGIHCLVLSTGRYQPVRPAAAVLPDGKSPEELHWEQELAAGLARATREGKPAMVDFWASWCQNCIKLEKVTFTDPAVRQEMKRFVLIRVDMTQANDTTEQMKAAYSFSGIPVVAFHGRDGRLLPEPRLRDYAGPEEFLELIRQVK